ncbi:MAG: M28 family metallopeptidase [Cyanobacteria bacterium J06635_1]
MFLKRNESKFWLFALDRTEQQSRQSRLERGRLLGHRLICRSLLVSLGVGLLGCSQTSLTEMETVPETVPPEVGSARTSDRTSETLSDVQSIVDELLAMGPRTAGSAAAEEASQYLQSAYEQLGYEVRIEPFTYEKFLDQGSYLTVSEGATGAATGLRIEGHALQDSAEGTVQAPLVGVPGVGQSGDFEAVDVTDAIAIVQRGEITFLEKTQNAIAAGAVGVIIINTEVDNFFGTLGEAVSIPVFSLSGEDGEALNRELQGDLSSGQLTVNVERQSVTGRNVIAHQPGVTQPRLIIGGHYDSVADSPGANDNASGTAAVLNLAQQLADTPLGDNIWFIAFDGEEDGLHGSRAFVRDAPADFLAGLDAMLNFDMVGVNDDLTVGGTDLLTDQLAEVPGQFDLGSAGGGSDHVPFARAEVPVLFFTRGLDPNYHQPTDQTVSPTLIEDTVQTGRSVIEMLLSEESQL